MLGKDGHFRRYPANKAAAAVVDTTGAGDSFAGAFAHGIAAQFDLQKTLLFASKVASISVTKKGTQKSYPDITTVQSVL